MFALDLWVLYTVIAAVFVLPIAWLSLRRVHWYGWELLGFILPFCVWYALSWFGPQASSNKGIGNDLFEPSLIMLTTIVAALFRVMAARGHEEDQRVDALSCLAFQCVTAAIIFFVTPNLGGSLG